MHNTQTPPRRGDSLQQLAIIGLLFLLPLILFWPQTVGGRTLLPTENLYQFEPFATYREVVQAPAVPHNHLLDDLVLQNFQWKSFIRDQFAQGEIPLWNPHQFSGAPFMAAGQQSTLYPLSILYYILPLAGAYGWFTVINLWLAGVFMYAFAQAIGSGRFGATIAGITYQLCGMFIASAVHPMIIGAVVWLPLLLLMAEYLIRGRTLFNRSASAIWAAIGAIALAFNVLAGHPEIMIYTLLILAYYSGARLLWRWWTERGVSKALVDTVWRSVWLAAMVVLGLGLGAVQLVPLYEVATDNWRAERSDLATVLTFAHPPRDLIQFALPNFYGSPAHHTYFDVFSGETVEIGFVNANGEFRTHTDWGFKNYVEGALYLGILPLALAAFALYGLLRRRRDSDDDQPRRLYKIIFLILTLASLTFAFGLPTYAAIYVLPGINQLNTPFRWIYGVTVGVALLAAFGAGDLIRYRTAARRFGMVLAALGVLTLLGLFISRLIYPQIEPVISSALDSLAKANEGFDGPRMFYSYQFANVLIFALVTLASGAAIWLGTRPDSAAKITPGRVFAVALVAVDLMIASWAFNPASDPLLLDFTPPSVQWLQEQPGEFRYIVINDPAAGRDILPPNVTLRYGLDDIRGYDSIISRQYVAFMRDFYEQNLLDHNRIDPLYVWDDYATLIQSPEFKLLNIRYIITHKTVQFPAEFTQAELRGQPLVQPVYEDEAVRIWAYRDALPRAFTLQDPAALDSPETLNASLPATITRNTGRERFIDLQIDEPTTLVVSETYMPGWRAYIRPQGAAEGEEQQLEVARIFDNFQGVALPDAGQWTVRMIYSPPSFQVGAFGTVISAAVLLLLAGSWLWRGFIVRSGSDQTSAASRLARNSIAPILLNLFNRGIDFAFAAVMFRLLGPELAGFYYYAIAIFGWFDIISNFGLDVYLMREAGRNRAQGLYYFTNTTVLRFGLVVICIPLLLAFLLIRQSAATPLDASVLLTIALFYVGLIPGTISKGLTSLFYAFEQAEFPAAITTITTIFKVTGGLLALMLGWGIVGLAAVSIFTNVVTLGVLFYGARGILRQIRQLRAESNSSEVTAAPRGLFRRMTGESLPLMLNHLLATIFFQIDIVLLEFIRGAGVVGLYRVAYNWLLAINIIPAFYTQALLPVMSRQAQDDRAAMRRTYTLSIKMLVAIALPLAVGFTFMAEPLTWILGGSAYLPDGAIALQIMIWSIPIGWMNSLTQYALVALDLQRRITGAFAVAVAFNIVTNLIFIPQYGFRAAAVTTILSELVLLIPFALLMQRGLGRLPWLEMIWRPVAAAGAMFAATALLWAVQPLLALIAGTSLYVLLLLALRPLNADEIAFLAPAFPAPLRRLVGAAS